MTTHDPQVLQQCHIINNNDRLRPLVTARVSSQDQTGNNLMTEQQCHHINNQDHLRQSKTAAVSSLDPKTISHDL